MPTMPNLSELAVQNWTDSGSYQRGRRYYQNGHILQPRRQGQQLKGLCTGSAPAPYRVEVTLDADGIQSSRCSCPLGGGCKHCVALLLTWVHEPESFREQAEMESVLAERSKEELIALVLKMVERHPDLELLLEVPTVGGAATGKAVDPETIRAQVLNATEPDPYDRYGYHDYGGGYEQIESMIQLGHDYAQSGDYVNATTVYITVIESVLDNYEMYYDEEGEISFMVGDCTEGLARCLEHTDDAAERERIFRSLFYTYKWDIDFGGIGMGDEGYPIMLEQSSPGEKARIAGWVREAMPTGSSDDFSTSWRREAYGGFLLALEGDTLDDEAFLRISRETGRTHELVDRLLAMGRVDEAVQASKDVADYRLTGIADTFRARGYDEHAWRLVEERATSTQDPQLMLWLKSRAEERGDPALALNLAKTLFWKRPGISGYEEIRNLAEQLDCWPPEREQILTQLADQKNYLVLTDIHLKEQDIDAALRTVQQVTPGMWGTFGSGSIVVRVANAAESARPEAAIRIYLEEAERMIAARGRSNYAMAAQHLRRVRDLYERLDQTETWNALIASIREQNSRLRAMQDEFNQAGL